MFNLTSAKITGNPDTSGWSQVHEFKPEESEKFETRGHLLAVVSASKSDLGLDEAVSGREILTRLHEEYFGKEGVSAFNALKGAIEKVIAEFDLAWGGIEIAATVFLKDTVYSAAGGGAQIAIFRNGMFAKILESTKGVAVSASGYPKEDDLLLLGTKAFFTELTSGVIGAALEAGNPSEIAETLAPSIHAQTTTGNLGVVVIKFNQEKVLSSEVAPKVLETTPVASGGFTNQNRINLPKINLKFKWPLIGKLWPRKIYVRSRETDFDSLETVKNKKTVLSVGIVLLILLLVSIGLGVYKKKTNQVKEKYQSRLNTAMHNFDEAQSLFSLEPNKARQLFSASQSLTEALLAEGVKDPALNDLVVKLKDNRGKILGEYKSEVKLFLDLGLLTSGFEGKQLVLTGNDIYVLDVKNKKIASVKLDTKKSKIIAGPDLIGKVEAITGYEDRVFFLNSQGIFEVDGENKKKVVDKTWEGEVLLYAYANNLYLLDKVAKTIWRFPGIEKTFGAKQTWLAPGINLDFSGASMMTIDGSIWIAEKSGRIEKLTLGSPQNLSEAGVTNIDGLYTNEELKSLYLLDNSQGRIVVLDKDGNYLASYFAEEVKTATGLIVSEKEAKIILLNQNKLNYLEIKHL